MKKSLALLALPLFISSCANTVEVEESIKYRCGTEIIKVDFLEDDTAILNLNGTNYALSRVVSASGAKYQGEKTDLIFWNKGRKSYLEMGNKKYPECQEIVR